MRRLLSCPVFVLVVLAPSAALAAEAPGTPEAPVIVDALPYVRAGTTVGAASSVIARYDCAPELDESGPERVFTFELAAAAKLTAWIEGDDDVVDVDVHIVRDLQVGGDGTATGCLARGNTIAEIDAEPGSYSVVVDTYAGDAQAGAYVLRVHSIADAWLEHPIGEGLLWRARRYPDIAGGPQVVHTVVADTSIVEIDVVLGDGCETVASTVSADPMVRAAINSSFFSFETCGSVSLMKSDGVVLFPNGGSPRGAFAIDSEGMPAVDIVPADGEWPEMPTAQGGGGWLVSGGVARGPDDWAEEGVGGASFLGPNPRTAIGVDADGNVVAGTFDGRRSSAAGYSLEGLASFGIDELGLAQFVNLDGGGSSTMWIRGATPSGVANYPSDAGMIENADHSGSRAVVGAIVFRGEPYNFAPRFQTMPELAAAADASWVYDADALDLNPEDTVAFSLVAGPQDVTVDAATGDVAWTPTVESPPMVEITLRASDGHGGETDQVFVLAVAGGMGPAEDDGADASEDASGTDDGGVTTADDDDGSSDADSGDDGSGSGAASGENEGCGCRTSAPSRAEGFGVLALVVAARRRRRVAS